MATIISPAGLQLNLDSRQPQQVPNWHNSSAPLQRDLAVAQTYAANYPNALHRPTSVSYGYNCHGLTFGARRTQITSSVAIRAMMSQDGYSRIHKHTALPGDIVIYVGENGDLEHSGVVVTRPTQETLYNMKVLSKWGSAHEVVHDLGDCPYDSTRLEFYRLDQ